MFAIQYRFFHMLSSINDEDDRKEMVKYSEGYKNMKRIYSSQKKKDLQDFWFY